MSIEGVSLGQLLGPPLGLALVVIQVILSRIIEHHLSLFTALSLLS